MKIHNSLNKIILSIEKWSLLILEKGILINIFVYIKDCIIKQSQVINPDILYDYMLESIFL
jgi:hypothetical protein